MSILNSLYNSLPFLISFLLSMFIYTSLNSKFKITYKIFSKLPLKDEWKPFCIIASAFALILIVNLLKVYVSSFPEILCSTLTASIMGISLCITERKQVKRK